MTFTELKKIIESKMTLINGYQLLMLKSLIDAGGSATVKQLAGIFLTHDASQVLHYYEQHSEEMPIMVLSKFGILKRRGDLVSLKIDKLTLEQQAELKEICERQMQVLDMSKDKTLLKGLP